MQEKYSIRYGIKSYIMKRPSIKPKIEYKVVEK